MNIEHDFSLYLVTDRELCNGRGFLDTVEEAVHGGVTVVQLREKLLPCRLFFEQALALKKLLSPKKIPLVINDRVDIALAIDADGVHIGQDDMPVDTCRRILGPHKLLGVSVTTEAEAAVAVSEGADYLGVSPVYATPTKTDTAPPVGLAGICVLRKSTSVPLVGIGGINESNAAAVISAGCDGIAVVSAIMAARDPRTAARNLLREIWEVKKCPRT